MGWSADSTASVNLVVTSLYIWFLYTVCPSRAVRFLLSHLLSVGVFPPTFTVQPKRKHLAFSCEVVKLCCPLSDFTLCQEQKIKYSHAILCFAIIFFHCVDIDSDVVKPTVNKKLLVPYHQDGSSRDITYWSFSASLSYCYLCTYSFWCHYRTEIIVASSCTLSKECGCFKEKLCMVIDFTRTLFYLK